MAAVPLDGESPVLSVPVLRENDGGAPAGLCGGPPAPEAVDDEYEVADVVEDEALDPESEPVVLETSLGLSDEMEKDGGGPAGLDGAAAGACCVELSAICGK